MNLVTAITGKSPECFNSVPPLFQAKGNLMPVTQAEIEAALDAHHGNRGNAADKMKAALEAAERTRWQPIETAPKDGDPIIVFRLCSGWRVLGYARWVDVHGVDGWLAHGFHEPPGNLGLGAPTHWQPLPSPPESK